MRLAALRRSTHAAAGLKSYASTPESASQAHLARRVFRRVWGGSGGPRRAGPNSEHSSRTGRVYFALTTVFTARRPQGAPVRGVGPLKTAKMARKGVKIDNGRLSRSDDPFFRIPHVLNGLEPPIRPPSGVGAVAVEGGENGPIKVKVRKCEKVRAAGARLLRP